MNPTPADALSANGCRSRLAPAGRIWRIRVSADGLGSGAWASSSLASMSKANRELARDAGVVHDQRGVGPDGGAVGDARRSGRGARASVAGPWIPAVVAPRRSARSTASRADVVGECLGRRQPARRRGSAAEPQAEVRARSGARRRRRPAAELRRRGSRRPRVEARAAPSWPIVTTGTPRVSRYSRVAGDVEDRLRAGADDGHRRPRELLEIGRDVERSGRRAAAGRARRGGRRRSRPSRRRGSRRRGPRSSSPRRSWPPSRHERAPPRGSAAPPSGRSRRGAVASASRSASVEPDEQPAVVDRDGRRHGAGLADRRLGGARDLEVLPGTAGRG